MKLQILAVLNLAVLVWLALEVRALRMTIRRKKAKLSAAVVFADPPAEPGQQPSSDEPIAVPARVIPGPVKSYTLEDEAVARKTLALARKGVAFAQCSIGKLYERGFGLSQDLGQAVYWYEAASRQHHAEAQFLLGLCRQEGKGIQADEHEAEGLFRRSAAGGWAEAQYRLALILDLPVRSVSDRKESRFWLEKAAQQGHLEARRRLIASHKAS